MEDNKKDTAVEWLIKEITSGKLFDWNVVLNQSLQMEKEQMALSYFVGAKYVIETVRSGESPMTSKEGFEQYYKGKYEK